jgi:hypothetical protein
MHACDGTPLQGLFWQDVRRIVAGREYVHPLVSKWARGEEGLGIRVDVYKVVGEKKYWRYGKRL